jgi:hypothetical protein
VSAEAVQDEKSVERDPSVKYCPPSSEEEMDPTVKESPPSEEAYPRSEEESLIDLKVEKQVDPEVKPARSPLQKLAISTAVGGMAGGAFYLIRSNKVGSVVLGLASLAVTYIVT